MKSTVVLRRGSETVVQFEVGARPIELGSALGCDIIVCDPLVAPRHALVVVRSGTLYVHWLAPADVRCSAMHVAYETPIPIGESHTLVRTYGDESRLVRVTSAEPRTAFDGVSDVHARLSIRARGKSWCLDHRPLVVGSTPDADIYVDDALVSRSHCRFEPHRNGVAVRDLGSRNGTHVNGIRVRYADLPAGAELRVGGTTLRVVTTDATRRTESSRIVAVSSCMQDVLALVERAARVDWPVLVQGESGVGKELIAGELHRQSHRSSGPLVSVNVATLARETAASELFGHERGAFTGASGTHRGLFEQANGGTLLLDEIGELSLELQAQLLRTLETGQVRRLGGEGVLRVDTRVVCATHRDLAAMVAAGTFRADLFHRLSRVTVQIPPLRSRREDLRLLLARMLDEVTTQLGPRRLSADARRILMRHTWPGNVRELRNVISAAALAAPTSLIDTAHVDVALSVLNSTRRTASQPSIEELESALRACQGNVSHAARSLGLPRSTLRSRIARVRSG